MNCANSVIPIDWVPIDWYLFCLSSGNPSSRPLVRGVECTNSSSV